MPITVAESKMRYDDLMHLLDAYEPQYDDWQPEPPAPYRTECSCKTDFEMALLAARSHSCNDDFFCGCSGKGYILAVDEN